MKRLLILFAAAAFLSGCARASFVDDRDFDMYYMGISGIHPGETATSAPSYIGARPSEFEIYTISLNGNIYYNPKIDGKLNENSSFFVDPSTGNFKLQNSSSLRTGRYAVGIKCRAAGKTYSYPEAVTIIMEKSN